MDFLAKWGLSLSWSNVKRKTNEACCSASAGLWAVRSWVHILPLPVIPEVTLGGHSNGSLTIPRCKIGIGLGLEIQSWLWGSLRTRESRARVMNPPWPWSPWAVNRSPKQRVPVAPQNDDLPSQKKFKQKTKWMDPRCSSIFVLSRNKVLKIPNDKLRFIQRNEKKNCI